MTVDLYVCFRTGGESLVSAFRSVLDEVIDQIDPTEFNTNLDRDRQPFDRAELDAYLGRPDFETVNIDGDSGELRLINLRSTPMTYIIAQVPSWPTSFDFIELAFTVDSFTAALIADSDDVRRQNARSEFEYRNLGMTLDGETLLVDDTGYVTVDVSSHPGRRRGSPGFWLLAASKMWFGPAAFEVIDRQALIDFGPEVSVRADAIVEVDLFSVGDDLDRIRSQQSQFRNHLDYDHLERTIGCVPEFPDSFGDRLMTPPLQPRPAPRQAAGSVNSSIVDDVHVIAAEISEALTASAFRADFSPSSLWEIDRFFDEHTRGGKPRRGGLLSEDLGKRLFGIGSYVGEVIRRELTGAWSGDDSDPSAEISVALTLTDGNVLWPVQRVMSRLRSADDSVAAYGAGVGLDVGPGPGKPDTGRTRRFNRR